MEPLRTIGDYRLIASLGEGGMAQVYLGMTTRTTGFQKLLVLKVLRTDFESEEDLNRAFQAEAKIVARLNHPNVVQTYEAGNDGGVHFLAMEYLEGQALNTIYAKVGRANVPLGLQLRVLCDLLEGLEYAHDLSDYDGSPLNLVHRDVSPHNVIVTYSGGSKLLDFGIARVAGMTKTQEGVVKGKIGYMAPEQLCGTRIDRRADIFAVGVILWEALAARRMHEAGEGDMTIMSRRVAGTEPKIRTIKPDIPPELAVICDKAMAFEPNDRYATAAEMRAAIEAYARANDLLFDARAVSAFLATHFAEQREQLRKRINDHLKGGALNAPILRLGANPGAGVTSSLTRDAFDHTPGGSERMLTESAGRKRRLYVGVAVVLVAVGAGASLLRPKTEATAPLSVVARANASVVASATASTDAASQKAPPVDASAPIHVRVRVKPPNASVTLDGASVRAPVDATFPRDEATHTIVAQLQGYATQRRAVQATGDQDVEIQLAPVAGVRAPTVTVTTSPAPSSTSHGRREVDQDPYR